MEDSEPAEKYYGYLFAKLNAIGTRSEGPQYYLQHSDYLEERIIKQCPKNQEDSNLHCLVGRKVCVYGKRSLQGIVYERLELFAGDARTTAAPTSLDLSLEIEADALWVEREPDDDHRRRLRQHFDLTLLVSWPHKGLWAGVCPTTQIFDFSIWHEGREIWRWSDGRYFADVQTPIHIPGGTTEEFSVTWHFTAADIPASGTYVARGTFLALGEAVERHFELSLYSAAELPSL